MKKSLLLLFLLPFPSFAESSYPLSATGFEAGVARISDSDNSLIGPSWVYHFEYRPAEFFSFLGQAGSTWGKDNDVEFRQNIFSGGIQFHPLPVLQCHLSIATVMSEVTKDADTEREQEVGPVIGLSFRYPLRAFQFGSSATVVRTSNLHSTALRLSLLLAF